MNVKGLNRCDMKMIHMQWSHFWSPWRHFTLTLTLFSGSFETVCVYVWLWLKAITDSLVLFQWFGNGTQLTPFTSNQAHPPSPNALIRCGSVSSFIFKPVSHFICLSENAMKSNEGHLLWRLKTTWLPDLTIPEAQPAYVVFAWWEIEILVPVLANTCENNANHSLNKLSLKTEHNKSCCKKYK